jgi:hypothetical protein
MEQVTTVTPIRSEPDEGNEVTPDAARKPLTERHGVTSSAGRMRSAARGYRA